MSRARLRELLDRATYVLALLPVLTDFVDTGHWPSHPREVATEVVLGLLLLVGIHRLHRRTQTLRKLVEVDPLTSLANRRAFEADLERALARARKTTERLAVAMVDVDCFKLINDSLGHAIGDAVLREVGRSFERNLRSGVDRCYRIGGDEFAILMPGLDARTALFALRRATHESSDVPLDVRCSVGAATLLPGESAEQVVRRADSAMYSAKRSGRHAVLESEQAFARLLFSARARVLEDPINSEVVEVH